MEPVFLERDWRCRFVGSLLPDLLDQRCSAQVFEVFLRYTGYDDVKHPDTLGVLQVVIELLLSVDRCEENKLDEHSRQKIDLILFAISSRLLGIGKELKEKGMCVDRDPFSKREFSTEGRRGWKLRNLVKELRDGAKGHKDRRIAADWSDDVEVGFRIVDENQGRINFDNQAARMRKNSWLEMGRLIWHLAMEEIVP
ncbi:hypothetical protein K4K60_003078 [Colletotrichum sp. SAR11_57]|nr:hypothetical protein K4K60_003078 [Colletotrichum sp. SAR11_57]